MPTCSPERCRGSPPTRRGRSRGASRRSTTTSTSRRTTGCSSATTCSRRISARRITCCACEGLVDKPLEIPLAELKKMPSFTTQAMVECAGSGRGGFQPRPSGTPWLPTGGMGCPTWTGVSLARRAEARRREDGAVHVAFSGDDVGAVPTAPKVIRSIPMAKAMERHTMIVWGMNGGDLPKIHGYPLRMVVPGWVGSASTKWLSGSRCSTRRSRALTWTTAIAFRGRRSRRVEAAGGCGHRPKRGR